MISTFEALVDPTRRRILDLLRERPHSVSELVGLLKMSQPGISKHLWVLREAGLVSVRQDAQRRYLSGERVKSCLPGYQAIIREGVTKLHGIKCKRFY